MKSTQILVTVLAGILIITLSSCGGIGLVEQSVTTTYKGLPTPDTKEQIAVNDLLKQAVKISRRDRMGAIDLYLEAAERTQTGAIRGGTEGAYYRFATGHAVELLNYQPKFQRNKSSSARYRITYSRGKNLFDPAQFDSVSFADAIKVKNISVMSQPGIGAPMVCIINNSAERKKAHPFLHTAGISTAATAVIEFPAKGTARISLFNTRRGDQVVFRGVTRTLAANLTVPLVSSFKRAANKSIGVKGILNPAAFFDEMGLYSTELMDPTKIPVVFTHGLGSKPMTWGTPYNALLGEKFFRENYQVYEFYYPTGLPPLYPAAALRQELDRLHRELKMRGAGRNADRVILVGHSMGGLMTSFQIRDFRGTSSQIFLSPIKELPIAPTSRSALLTMLESPPPRFVKRAVFISTPHRGSAIAGNWLGRFGSVISRVPKELLTFQFGDAARTMTRFGRGFVLDADPLDGIARLRVGNPLLNFTLERPVAYGVPYHSIIGDRGRGGGFNRGDDPESTDGTVAYWSSHLDGAVSEKIVPSHHGAHTHSEGITELKRIFRLHLRR